MVPIKPKMTNFKNHALGLKPSRPLEEEDEKQKINTGRKALYEINRDF